MGLRGERLLNNLKNALDEGAAGSVSAVRGALSQIEDYGDIWYVDSVGGTTYGLGKSWSTAFSTITLAVAAASAGDIILCRGSTFSEAVTVSLAGLQIIGVGNTPNEAIWTADADAVCLTIAADSVLVTNFRIRPPAYSADRTTCGINISAAPYVRIIGNRFQGKAGSQIAIYGTTASSVGHGHILNNEFAFMNTATYGTGIDCVGTGGGFWQNFIIRGNYFNSCVVGIDMDLRYSLIEGNYIYDYGLSAASALESILDRGIDLTGGYGNIVTKNYLAGDYSTATYIAATGDSWIGNTSDDIAETTEVGAETGITFRVPQA